MFAVDSALEVAQASKEDMLLCWPALALALIGCFSLGCCLGKVWGACPHKEGQRQKEYKDTERVGVATEVIIKTGSMHRERDLEAKEFIGEYEREGDVTVFLTKTGTKVHLIKDCPGLNSADLTKMKRITICKHCLRSRRLLKID